MDILSTTTINSLINNYRSSETNKSISPLQTRKDKYSKVSSAYNSLLTKLNSLKSELSLFSKTGTESVFSLKSASSSNTNFISTSASSTALTGNYEVHVNQLAKKDSVLSSQFISADISALTGNHSFKILCGDGEGGTYTSNIEVDFSGTETNKSAMEKIQNAINSDKAKVDGVYKNGDELYSGGAAEIKLNLNGTEQVISVDAAAVTYSELLDSIADQLNEIDGITAEKTEDPENTGMMRLSVTVNDSSKFISITNESGYNIVSDLGINLLKEKGASGIFSASSFSPVQNYSQLNISVLNSGLDFRIMEISDLDSGEALSSFGLNMGNSRPAFVQDDNTAGFLYTDTSLSGNRLNAKFNFNGIDIQRNSNTVTDLAEGLTINLKSVMTESEPSVNIAVSSDSASIKSKVESFLQKFNDAYTFLKTGSSYTSGTRGALYGDSSAQTILSFLSSVVYDSIPGSELQDLASLGISFNPSSGLSISDASLFESKMKNETDQAAELFNSESGLAVKLLNFIEPYLGSSGYLSERKTSVDLNIQSANDRIKSIETRINKSADMLRKRYEQLQVQLASLLSTQSYFSTDSTSYF